MAIVSFDKLQDGSREDFILMAESYKVLCSPSEMTKRALGMLLDQRGIFGGAKVDLYEHALQTATRAYQNGEDEESVVCCLLRDIGELLSPSNHGEIPAAIRNHTSQRNGIGFWPTMKSSKVSTTTTMFGVINTLETFIRPIHTTVRQ